MLCKKCHNKYHGVVKKKRECRYLCGRPLNLASGVWQLPIRGSPPLSYLWHLVKGHAASRRFQLDSVMITNGYLLDQSRLRTLTNLGVKTFQISFDGDEDTHDKMRVTAADGPTFARIWGNILQASQTALDFSIIMRIHLNGNNYSSVSKFLERISAGLGRDRRFLVHIRGLSRMGGPNDALLPVLSETELEDPVSKSEAKARELGLRTADIDSSVGEAGLAVCYASKFNSFVIRSDGRRGRCTVALYDEKNFVGWLREDGTLDLDEEKIRWWGRGNFSRDPFELTCPWVARLRFETPSSINTRPVSTP